jgi:hypothetical protein
MAQCWMSAFFIPEGMEGTLIASDEEVLLSHAAEKITRGSCITTRTGIRHR